MPRMLFRFFFFILISSYVPADCFDPDCFEVYEFVDDEENDLNFDEEIEGDHNAVLAKSVYKHSSGKNVPDSNYAMETLEAGPSAIVAGCVNAITGDFFDSHVAMTVSGAEPLIVQCFYCSSEKIWNFQHMSSLNVGCSGSLNNLYALYLDDSGSGLTYRSNTSKSIGNLSLPSTLFKKGLTNCGSGIISGKTNWKNSSVSLVQMNDKESYMLTHGSGIKRIFARLEQKCHKKISHEGKLNSESAPLGEFFLESENHTNGNCLHYRYKNERLTRIKAVNQANQTLSRLTVSWHHHKNVKWQYDGGFADFDFEDSIKTRIRKITPSHAVPVSYEYNHSFFLEKKVLPEGRFLEIKYKSSKKSFGRVSYLKNPLGLAYTFDYDLDLGRTSVTDAENNLTKYCYDKKTKRLQHIQRYNKAKQIISQDNFYWSVNGNLDAKTFEGGGKCYFSRVLGYDNFNNVTLDRLFGNLTGKALHPLQLNGACPTTPCDEYVKIYHYSQDGLNLLLVENDGKKLICCDYHPNQLLKHRFTKIDNIIVKREFFTYDISGVLIENVWDDGQAIHKDDLSYVNERHIKRITPRTEAPIGLPQIVEEYYLDMASHQCHLLQKTVNHHSPQGKVQQEDHYGSDGNFAYSLKLEYNNLGNVIKQTDALGQTKTFDYDGNGNKIREIGPRSGWQKEFKYDLCNRLFLEKECWPDGTILITKHGYNKINQRISTTNPYGQLTIYDYNALGHLVKTQSPSLFTSPFGFVAPVEEYEYDAMGNAIVHKDGNGHITKTSYTIRGQPYRIEYPDGTVEQKEYSLDGLLIKEIAKNGLITTYTYDPFDRLISTVIGDPDGTSQKTKTVTYSTFHKRTETDEEGIVTIYGYDWAGRCISMRKGDHLAEYQYDPLGRIVKTINSIDETNVRITCHAYDLLDRVIEERIEDAHGEVFKQEKYSYDVDGNKASTTIFTQAGEAKTEAEYLPNGNPSCITDALGNKTRYFYDHTFSYKGQTVLYVNKVDAMGNREVTFYDTHGNVCYNSQIDPFLTILQQEISYYDPLGHKTLSEITVFQGGKEKHVIETRWEYDAVGNLKHCIEAVGTPKQKIVSHHYNQYGQKERTDMPNGISIIHEYDIFGRLLTYKSSDKSIHYQYTYDKKDHPTLVEDLIHNTATGRSYDEHGRLKLETLDNGLTLTYTYDQLDRPVKVVLPNQSAIRYQYNALHLIAAERLKGDEVAYTHCYSHYDQAGNVTEETLLGEAGTVHYKYDLLERPIFKQAPHWQETIPQDGFDLVGNLLKREVTDKQGALTYTYAYDSLYQLKSESGFISHTYQNDSLYNRTLKDGQPYEVNALNQLLSQTNCTYHYDDNGNLIDKTTDNHLIRYVYDALDRLIEVHNGSDVTVYTYDSFHRRLSKNQNGVATLFLYQNQNEIGALNQGEITQLRILGVTYGAEIGGAIALELNGKVYVPIHDPHGNIVALLDTSGNLVEGYRYTAFGEIQVFSENTVDNPWRFSSKRHDTETGFVFFGRRYYDPDIGRWTTPDPAGYADGPNLYAYVHNRPLVFIDPDGLFATAAYQATVAACTQFGEGLSFGQSNGLDSCPGIRNEYRGFFFETGAALGSIGTIFAPLDKALISVMNFLSPTPHPEMTLGAMPFGPGGSACVIKSFLQTPKNTEAGLSLLGRMQRTQTVAFNSLNVPNPASREILFAQKSVSPCFSELGNFRSMPISEVAKGLRNGVISPNQLPIEIIMREGQCISLNNRSLLALRRAGMEPTILIDQTGKMKYESLLRDHLRGTEPSNVIRIRGGLPGSSLIE